MWRICCCSTELTKLTELTELTEPVSRKQTDVKWRQTCRWNIWTSDVTEQVGHICMNWSLIICGTVTSGELWRVTSSDQRDQMKVVDPNMRPSPVTCSELCGSEPWCGLSVLPPFHWTHQALCTVWMCKLTRVSGLCSRTGSARLGSARCGVFMPPHPVLTDMFQIWGSYSASETQTQHVCVCGRREVRFCLSLNPHWVKSPLCAQRRSFTPANPERGEWKQKSCVHVLLSVFWSCWLLVLLTETFLRGRVYTWCYSRFWSGHVIWTVKVLTRSLCWGARCCCVSVQTPSQCHSFVGCWVRGNFINCV